MKFVNKVNVAFAPSYSALSGRLIQNEDKQTASMSIILTGGVSGSHEPTFGVTLMLLARGSPLHVNISASLTLEVRFFLLSSFSITRFISFRHPLNP